MGLTRLLTILLILTCGACNSSSAEEATAKREEAVLEPAPREPAPRDPPKEAHAPASPGSSAARGSTVPVSGLVCPAHLSCDYDALIRDPTTHVSAIRVEKGPHRLHLLAGETVVKSYSVALGYGGAGPKLREGDGVTPIGTYKITGRLPTSPWHLLLGVSYPNYEDVKRFARLKAAGEVPHDANIGFGIALHGRRSDMADGQHKKSDWTLGCIAVDNHEIEEISRLVKTGTTITIVD